MKKHFKFLAVTSLIIAFTSCKSSQETTSTTPSSEPSSRTTPNKKNISQLFIKMDSNNDGKISKSEAKGKLKENFIKRDKNNDGFITKNEMVRRKK